MDPYSQTMTAVSLLCLLVGTPLNFLAVAYFARNPSRTLASRLFMMISAIDGVLCLSMLHNFISLLSEVDVDTGKHSTICILVSWIWNILSRLSLFLSSVLSVTRSISLHRPFSNIPTRPIVLLMVVELVYLVLYESAPWFTGHRVPVYHFGTCDWTVDDDGLRVPYHICYSLAYYLPVILTIGGSSASFCSLRKNKLKFSELKGKKANTYFKQCYAANTILILVIIYALCNVPYAIVLFILDMKIITGDDTLVNMKYFQEFLMYAISLGAVYLVVINAAITPVVFLLRIREFKLFIKRAPTTIHATVTM